MAKSRTSLISATKQITNIKKKIRANIIDLKKYSAATTIDDLYFDSVAEQKKEVKSLVKANENLATQYIQLKLKIDQANVSTKVVMSDGKEYSISQLLAIKRELEKLIKDTFNALGEEKKKKKGKIIRFYSEAEKRKKVKKWNELFDQIDEQLDDINASTSIERI